MPAGPDQQLRTARDHRLHGRYDEALAIHNALKSNPAFALRVACERAELDLDLGEYSTGASRLRAIESEGAKSARWHNLMGRLLAAVGSYEQAIEHHRSATRLDKSDPAGWTLLGQSLEKLGKTRDAIAAYKHCDDVMTGDALPDDAEALTSLGKGFYRYSELTKTNLVQRTRHVLDECFGTAIAFHDAAYWPARLASAELLLAKHNLADARGEFDEVLKQNPKVADAMVGLARSHLEDWNFDECESLGNRALEANPNHVGAFVLMADLRMTERKYARAAEFAERALKINPRSEDAIGVLAAARLRDGDRAASTELQKRVSAFNPTPAVFHFALGQWLSAGRQFEPAEVQFKKAIEYAAYWPEPRTSLGQLYMELGEEQKARKSLEASFELDSFNQHTFNVLNLLDRIDHFATLESEHFIIKYDADADAVAAPYFSRTLESVYADVCDDFNAKLKHKTIIELFPDHQGFSVRIAGRPFIGTIGACTGRVIAMTAPRGRPPFGRFNWASVLRHEFTHTVTLAVTENRIPHWFTEGLAVYEEPSPRSWTYKQLLTDAIRRDRLFTLQNVDWGFVRPKRPTDRSLAYAQSEWMSEYIIHRFKYQAILDLLAAFREGKQQEAAFQAVLKISTAQFDRDFHTWAVAEAAKWGLPQTPLEDPEEIEKT
ncbi:MAG: tetratricopeptide repeat protein [Planctomycetes bacterium]|nr:tetratricopeptide repeat protein [Planctomycetota bacterium]